MSRRPITIASRAAAVRAGLLAGCCGVALAAGAALGAPVATQLPSGGQVAAGAATLAQSGSSLTVTQTTPRAVIDWTTFDIGSAASVAFAQPSTASVTLNRVTTTTPSQIFGQMTANGQVFLVNPGGVYFAPGASVDVGGLVATSADMSDADFMAGSNHLDRRGAQGSVINDGALTAHSGGYIALLAPLVRNTGVITARLGAIALAAGDAYTLQIDGANTLADVIVTPATMQALVDNGGAARADGGGVLLSAQAADSLLGGVVRTSGVLEADGIDAAGGVIRLVASDRLAVDGAASARGGPSEGDGGMIETSAGSVQIGSGATIDTRAPGGAPGLWRVDTPSFTVETSGGNITGASLSAALGATGVIVQTSAGDIVVDDKVTWSTNSLTLQAAGAIRVDAPMAAIAAPLTLVSGSGTVAMGLTGDGFTGRIDFLRADGFTPRSGTGFLSIDGDPYTVITDLGLPGSVTGADLQGLNSAPNAHYALGADIDASPTVGWNGGEGFSPLSAYGFHGAFDGLGHTIAGLSIDRPNQSYVGLFAQADNATISNVGLTDAVIIGAGEVGGLVGRLTARDGEARVSGSFVTGRVTGGNTVVGGLVGRALATTGAGAATDSGALIDDSFSTAAVTSSLGVVGGLVGVLDTGSAKATATISGSFATGPVTELAPGGSLVGGLIGTANPAEATGQQTIIDSFATGPVTAAAGARAVGGLAGQLSSTTVINAFSSGQVVTGAGSTWTGALAGLVQGAGSLTSTFYDRDANPGMSAVGFNLTYTQKGDVAGAYWGMTTAQMKDPANFTGRTTANGGVDPGWAASGWTFDPAINHGYPSLTSLPNETVVTVYLLLLAGGSVYGATPDLAYEIYSNASGVGGAVIGDAAARGVAVWSTPLSSTSPAGAYSESYLGGLTLGNPDYRLSAGAPTIWTIAKAPLTLTAADRTATYGQGLTLGSTAFTATGLVNGDTVTSATLSYAGSATVPASTPAGSYVGAITIADALGAGLTNYAIAYVAGKLLIDKAVLTVTADNQVRPYGQPDPPFTESVSGFVAGDTATTANITGSATGSTTASLASPAGAYPIVGSTGTLSAPNYVFVARDGVLTIKPVPSPPPAPTVATLSAATDAANAAGAGAPPDSISTPEPPAEEPPPAPAAAAAAAPPEAPRPVSAPALAPAPPPATGSATIAPAAGGRATGAPSAPGQGGLSRRAGAGRICDETRAPARSCGARTASKAPTRAPVTLSPASRPGSEAARVARARAATTAAAVRGVEPAPGEPRQESFRTGIWLDNASPFDAGKSRVQREMIRDLNAASVMTTFTLFVLP